MSNPTIREQIEKLNKQIEAILKKKTVFLQSNGKYNDKKVDKMIWDMSRLYIKLLKKKDEHNR